MNKISTLQIPIRSTATIIEVAMPLDATVLAVTIKGTGFGNRSILLDVLGSDQTALRKFIALKEGSEAPDNVRYIGFACDADARDRPRFFLFEVLE